MQATYQVVQRAIDDCKECHVICVQTIQYSVQQGGPHVAPDHLRLLEDCAQLCQTSEDFMLRGSPLWRQLKHLNNRKEQRDLMGTALAGRTGSDVGVRAADAFAAR